MHMDPLEQARAYFSEALQHHNRQELTQAEVLYRKALALAPERLSIMVNLAVVLASSQQFVEARALGERALGIEPGNVDAQMVVAASLRGLAQPRAAAELLGAVAALHPQDAKARNNLGMALEELGDSREAARQHAEALRLAPEDPAAISHHAVSLAHAGHAAQAFALLKQALLDAEGHQAARAAFVHMVVDCGFLDPADPDYRRFAIDAVAAPWCRTQQIAPALVALLRADPQIERLVLAAAAAWPTRLAVKQADLTVLQDNDVLLALLTHTPITDMGLERLLTALRQSLLEAVEAAGATSGEQHGKLLQLHCALARQCYLNEYTYSLDHPELAQARALRQRLELALRVGMEVPDQWLATLGSYFPLGNIAGADALLAKSWPAAIQALLAQQVAEPAAERALRASIEQITAIQDPVSREVRQQYERNPYPRWCGAPAPVERLWLDGYLQQRFPASAYRPGGHGENLRVLNAGCGSGQHPIETALRFRAAEVVALDLSVASLAYAKRKARECGVHNIEFVQGDLLELSASMPGFDLIESDGVLHHLADPALGLRRLAAHLRPGGLMKLAFYSERARAPVAAAREHIASRHYTATPEGIRACRDDIAAMPPESLASRLLHISDFYALSECRDLLFHVQEHTFSLPHIGRLLADAGLAFIGLELTPAQLRAFETRFPGTRSRYDLDAWDLLEQQSPHLFIGMYQFWAQRVQDAD